ncbi:aminotransferase class I/II-fold pyridoxal phosphate-dependent enzyme [Patescibacteria group bacterium]|nr:aminotransferase class I/II-fold pyridoxal phosphate-dependent enzyme [Patescibacteria group bacterium]
MPELNPQATKLNEAIQHSSAVIFNLLSERGREIFFPHAGILGQTAEAKGKELNATIGMACNDSGSIMCLDCMSGEISIDDELVFPYASSFGSKKLRESWQKKIVSKNPTIEQSNISMPVVTSALTHGLNVVGYLFMDANTEIIMPEPYWGNYNLTFNITFGSKIITFPLFKDGKFNIKGLREKLNAGGPKKVILLNFPNNPSGYTPTNEETKAIVNAVSEYSKKQNVIVISDDAYFGLVYEPGVSEESIFSKFYKLSENILAVKIDGITKEDYAWGLRVGFVTFGCKNGSPELYNALEDKAAGAVRATISNVSHLSQSLILQAFDKEKYEEEKTERKKILRSRYEEIKKVISDNPQYEKYFKPLPYNSGYFMCLALSGKLDAEEIRKHLLESYDTGIIAVNNYLRIAYSSLAQKKLKDVFNNIYLACQDKEK